MYTRRCKIKKVFEILIPEDLAPGAACIYYNNIRLGDYHRDLNARYFPR